VEILIEPGSTILFQGDSITDAGRQRESLEPNFRYALGMGYCNLIASQLLREQPSDDLKFYNRGVSGDRIVDMYARWKVDAINLKPDIISILIGVNDTWHEMTIQNGVEPERYEKIYRSLLEYTKQQLSSVQFILCEPFVLKCGVVTDTWGEEIRKRQHTVRQLADEFNGRFVAFQSALDSVLVDAPPEYWLSDGVHPTPAGHRILADCWYENVIGKSKGE
jgi:lysophospholipase L1-like esterase